MRPELFRFFGVGFPAYFVLLVSGFLFATAVGCLWARRVGLSPDVVVDLGLAMLVSGVLGGRVLHVLADGYFWDYVHLCTDPMKVDWPFDKATCISPAYDGFFDAATGLCHPKEADCFAWAKFWAGGLTYYGGFIGSALGAIYLLRRDRFPFWKAADMAGFAVPLGLAFGRMGCLLHGCCFGRECELPWALTFPAGSAASEAEWKAHTLSSMHLPSHFLHPTQIYESAASLAISAFCLYWVLPRKRYDGQVFVVFVVAYAAARFVIEYFRDDDRGGIGFLSTSQWIGVLLIAGAGVAHILLQKRADRLANLSSLGASATPPPTGAET
jgi:phosphatidylglycerol:prolipoprotein diacylglycerol transferase